MLCAYVVAAIILHDAHATRFISMDILIYSTLRLVNRQAIYVQGEKWLLFHL